MAERATSASQHPVRYLAPLILPASIIGIASSLSLLLLSGISGLLEDLVWDTVPEALGVSGSSDGWIFLILSLTGLAVGLVVWKDPNHAGPDPATQSLVSPPLPPAVLPGLTVATILCLAGGVSLGPENPNHGDQYRADGRSRHAIHSCDPGAAVGHAGRGRTVGAMFGTPVAAALLLSETVAGDRDTPLWDRLFAPLVAAAAGGLTTVLIEPSLTFSLAIAPYRGPELIDLASATVIATAAALLGLASVYVFPRLHAWFRLVPKPMLMIPAGGVVLGILGVIGGELTLFKGLDQMKELTSNAGDYSTARLGVFALVKLAALVVAATCGLFGGRIFPATFVGVAAGLFAASLVPDVPQALAVGAAVLGLLLAVSRSGWLSLFMAVTLVADVTLLPVLVVALLPSWLVVAGQPEMVIPPAPDVTRQASAVTEQPPHRADELQRGEA
jgi:chloride channel protein, CIC family